MLYVVQRTDCARFRLAPDLDPGYARAFDAAREAGVEMLCHGTEISPDMVALSGSAPGRSVTAIPAFGVTEG
jgi:sugar fermentation stimulation protein A